MCQLFSYRIILAKPDSVCKSFIEQAMSEGWIHVQEIHGILAKSLYKTQLHDGEVEVMILAKEMGADLVILDDLNARKHADYLQLTITGTIGVLVKAKQLGYVTSLRHIFEQLLEHRIYT